MLRAIQQKSASVQARAGIKGPILPASVRSGSGSGLRLGFDTDKTTFGPTFVKLDHPVAEREQGKVAALTDV